MKFNENKKYQQASLWTSTHEKIDAIVDYYNEKQKEEFGHKAKKVSKAAVIDQLAEMHLFEIRKKITG